MRGNARFGMMAAIGTAVAVGCAPRSASGPTVSNTPLPNQASPSLSGDGAPLESARGGVVKTLCVRAGQTVRQGTLVAVLEDPEVTQRIAAAEAEVAAAEADLKASKAVSIDVPSLPSLPGVTPPVGKGPRGAIRFDVPSPAPLSAAPSVATEAARASLREATAQADTARAARFSANTEAKASQAALEKATAEVPRAQAEFDAATKAQLAAAARAKELQAPLDGLQKALDAAKAKADQFQKLFADGAISRRELNAKLTPVDDAQTAFDVADGQAKAASAEADLRESERKNAFSRLQQANASVAEFKAKIASAQKSTADAEAALKEAARIRQEANQAAAEAARKAASVPRAPLPAAPIGLAPLSIAPPTDRTQAARERLEKARQALRDARAAAKKGWIVAPADGTVAGLNVHPGDRIAPGGVVARLQFNGPKFVLAKYDAATRPQSGAVCHVSLTKGTAGKGSGLRLTGTAANFLADGRTVRVDLMPDQPGLDAVVPGASAVVTAG